MARTNIEEESFGKLSKFAQRIGWTEREALGLLCFLWHDSQIEGFSYVDEEELYDCCRLFTETIEEKQNVKLALLKSGFIKEAGNDRYLIRGNPKQIKTISAYKNRIEKMNAKRLEKMSGSSESHAGGEQDILQDESTTHESVLSRQQGNAKQGNAKQGNAMQVNAMQSDAMQTSVKPATAGYSEHFEKFWLAYPPEGRLNKAQVWKRYQAQVTSEKLRDDLDTALKNYIEHLRVTGYSCKHASSFLGTTGKRSQGNPWIDFVASANLPKQKTGPPSFAKQRSNNNLNLLNKLRETRRANESR